MKTMMYVDAEKLQKLLATGEILAHHVTNLADELDRSGGADPGRSERQITELWQRLAREMRALAVKAVDDKKTDDNGFLVLTRRRGEELVFDRRIRVTVLNLDRGQVRLGVEAPRSVSIHRGELLAQLSAGQR